GGGKAEKPAGRSVGGPANRQAGGMIDAPAQGARGAIRLWLLVLFGLVACMIAVGGLTRLTDSGLSITEWRPVMGAIPPLSEADWALEFGKYQASPQYKLMNAGMDLSSFKGIFWWEWAHRQLGRVIGLVWALGFLGFLLARRIPAGWTGRLLGLGALGGLQGAIGWWMVSSGLSGSMVSVASYRLATHLGLAFAILGLCATYIFQLGRAETDLMQARRVGERRLVGMATGVMHLLFLQILLGALVAGIDAGRAYPTWPLMGDGFFPPDPFAIVPLWRNFFEDPGLVQFLHRMTGYGLFILAILVWLRARKSAYQATQGAFNAVMIMLVLQVALGIYTALTSAQMHVALTHQLGAVALWVLVIRARHMAKFPIQGSIRKGTA
ncbi:MAG: heme A synthase, partial [Alphaproteobacteria bacterium]